MLEAILTAWGRILSGYRPLLSIEITRECPLSCPGCYAYNDQHLGGELKLRQVSDHKGDNLVNGVLKLVEEQKPLHLSIIGGEPLVRFRELNELLPKLSAKGIHVQIVTSAVRPIPLEWNSIPKLQICVSIDGLQPEHDARRTPATYDRILKHIQGHQITVHCTITRQQIARDGYLEEFVRFWSQEAAVNKIWFSLYTPQVGEQTPEILQPLDRKRVVEELLQLREIYPKVKMNSSTIKNYIEPPASPKDCVFARVTKCISADLKTKIAPCQFGGTPDCKNCGCMASAGLEVVGRYRLLPGLPISKILSISQSAGSSIARLRQQH